MSHRSRNPARNGGASRLCGSALLHHRGQHAAQVRGVHPRGQSLGGGRGAGGVGRLAAAQALHVPQAHLAAQGARGAALVLPPDQHPRAPHLAQVSRRINISCLLVGCTYFGPLAPMTLWRSGVPRGSPTPPSSSQRRCCSDPRSSRRRWWWTPGPCTRAWSLPSSPPRRGGAARKRYFCMPCLNVRTCVHACSASA